MHIFLFLYHHIPPSYTSLETQDGTMSHHIQQSLFLFLLNVVFSMMERFILVKYLWFFLKLPFDQLSSLPISPTIFLISLNNGVLCSILIVGFWIDKECILGQTLVTRCILGDKCRLLHSLLSIFKQL